MAVLPDPNNFKNALTSWSDYQRALSLNPGMGAQSFGYARPSAEVNRFGHRFRLANSFRGLKLDGYKASTAAGYDALTRLFLVWTAFELFLPAVVGEDQDDVLPLLAPYKSGSTISKVRAADAAGEFYTYISAHKGIKKQKLKQALLDYKHGTLVNPTYLAVAVRHVFGHGHLTANPGKASAPSVTAACDILSEFHLKVMDGEFSRIFKNWTGSFA